MEIVGAVVLVVWGGSVAIIAGAGLYALRSAQVRERLRGPVLLYRDERR